MIKNHCSAPDHLRGGKKIREIKPKFSFRGACHSVTVCVTTSPHISWLFSNFCTSMHRCSAHRVPLRRGALVGCAASPFCRYAAMWLRSNEARASNTSCHLILLFIGACIEYHASSSYNVQLCRARLRLQGRCVEGNCCSFACFSSLHPIMHSSVPARLFQGGFCIEQTAASKTRSYAVPTPFRETSLYQSIKSALRRPTSKCYRRAVT